MASLRHPQQRWDPTAEFEFRKSCTAFGVRVSGGDPVTPEMRAQLGEHPRAQEVRLRRLYDTGVIQIRDWQPPAKLAAAGEPIVPLGRGMFRVEMPDGTVRRVKGREAAAKLRAAAEKAAKAAK